jgi:hypothetical protein
MASGVIPSDVASGVLTPGKLASGAPADLIVGTEGRCIFVGISITFFCVRRLGHDAGRSILRAPFDQMVVAAEHAPGFTAARRVQSFEDTDEDIHAPARCGFNIVHR